MIIKKLGAMLKRFRMAICLVAAVAIILVNLIFFGLSVVGVGASLVYIVLVGYLLGETLLRDEDEFFSRLLFGIFLVISIFIVVGLPIVIVYELNLRSLAVVLLVPLVLLTVLSIFLRRRNLVKDEASEREKKDGLPSFSPIYIVPLALMAYSEFLLIKARSGWIYGTIWDVVDPSFLVTYFLAAFCLFGVILYSRTRGSSKMLLTMIFSLVSITVSAVVLYPGDVGDPLGTMGVSQLMFDYGTLRTPYELSLGLWNIYWLLKQKGLTLLTPMVARMFMVDVYWVHTFISPVLWGVFVPLVAYKIIKTMCGEERVSVLAALLTTFFSPFLIWGSISTANSFGYAFFFVSLYFAVRYMKSVKKWVPLLLAMFTAVVTGLVHPFTGEMALTFLFLAFSLEKYRTIRIKRPRLANILMLFAFISSLLIVQAAFAFQNFVYLSFANPHVRSNYLKEVIMLSPKTLLSTDLWSLVFGDYLDYSVKEVILSGVMPVLGFVGLVYALKKKDEYKRIFALFMFLAFWICQIDYVVMRYGMVNVPFGPGRIWIMRDLIAIPFMAVAIISVVKFFGGGTLIEFISNPDFKGVLKRFSAGHVVAWVLVGLCLGALATASVNQSYSLENTLHPTQLEVDAVKYIEEHTNERYVVLCTNTWMTMIGWGFVGGANPQKYYIYERFSYPSVADVMSYITEHKATVGYFVVPSFRTPDFGEVVAEASRKFGLFKRLNDENGEIYIFEYRIPPLPPGYPNPDADVMAFYWKTPTSYMVQNGFARVSFNPAVKILDVADFWGDLYERIDLNETLIDGTNLGNLVSVEYFDSSSETWISWAPSEDVHIVQQFQFRLGFEKDSLIGIVEKGKTFVQLRWESTKASLFTLEPGEFNRLYIPGLVGGKTPSNVRSRQFGLFYTLSRTDDVVLRPGYGAWSYSSSLNFSQIQMSCGLIISDLTFSYDFSVLNNASVDQWAHIEVWVPDKIYLGMTPSMYSSVDGGVTWTSGGPLKTLGGIDVNWAVSMPRSGWGETPVVWKYNREGAGGRETLPGSFTESSGGQNRLLFALYLPAEDEALVRLTVLIRYLRPVKITYVFGDSELADIDEGSIKVYTYGKSVYVGGLTSSLKPTALTIVEDETGKIRSISITIPADTTFSLVFVEGDTTADADEDKVPDLVEQ